MLTVSLAVVKVIKQLSSAFPLLESFVLKVKRSASVNVLHCVSGDGTLTANMGLEPSAPSPLT